MRAGARLKSGIVLVALLGLAPILVLSLATTNASWNPWSEAGRVRSAENRVAAAVGRRVAFVGGRLYPEGVVCGQIAELDRRRRFIAYPDRIVLEPERSASRDLRCEFELADYLACADGAPTATDACGGRSLEQLDGAGR